MSFKRGNPGRPVGSSNKTTRSAKEAIALAAEGLGGVKRLVAWAKLSPDNERVFWGTIYPRLVPHEVAGSADGAPISIAIVKPW